INQVAIVPGRPIAIGGETPGGPHKEAWRDDRLRAPGKIETHAADRTAGHPNAPTELLEGRSAAEAPRAARGDDPCTVTSAPREEGTSRPSRPRAATGIDSPCACEVEPTRSYEQAARPASGLPEGNPEAETGRLKRPPSALERAATERTARAGLSAQRMDHQLWDLGSRFQCPLASGSARPTTGYGQTGRQAPSSCIDGPRQCQGYPRAGSVGRPVTTRSDVPLKAWTQRDTHRPTAASCIDRPKAGQITSSVYHTARSGYL
ncbi:MAG: hypothetical protein L6R40_008761, partial [Gallowayella cf. fulva]